MSSEIVHVISRDLGRKPLCNFTGETDPKKWPTGNGFRDENDVFYYRSISDFINQITCHVCREMLMKRLEELPYLKSSSPNSFQVGKHPNLAVDIGD